MTISSEARFAVWPRLSRHWSHVGPPLRPSAEDVAFVNSVLADLAGAQPGRPVTSILLGVTPELAAMLAPTRTFEIDHSFEMIIWAAAECTQNPLASTVVADWKAMPVRGNVADFVVGDGCYSTAEFPEGYRQLSSEVVRVLRSGGKFVIRLFVTPETAETAEAVIEDLKNGRIGNCEVLRWRLNMALQESTTAGVRLGDTFTYWQGTGLRSFVTNVLGWPPLALDVMEAYRDMNTRFTFPTLAQVRGVLTEHFYEIDCLVPHYEIGERCPTLVLERR
jgi:SAM-dependent methyltransferase